MKIHLRQRSAVCLPLLVMASACSADVIDLGGGGMQQMGAGSGRCAASTVISGDVVVTRQSDLDALAGCEEITGDLRVALLPEASLLPLSALRAVGGSVELGLEPFVIAPPEGIGDEAYVREMERARAQREEGWLESLEGLEALARVGGLLIADSLAPDLHPLRQLTAIEGAGVGSGAMGTLRVVGAKNLRDLSGLENVRVGSVALSSNSLESLDGLQLDAVIESVAITDHPRLRDIQALASVTDVLGAIVLSGTALENLEGLTRLRTVREGIALIGNPRLSDASQLAQLQLTSSIQIQDNDLLTSLPSFDQLEYLDSLHVIDNAALEELRLEGEIQWSGEFYELGEERGEGHLTPAVRVEIQRNPSLRRFTSPAGPLAVQYLTIEDNPVLTHIDLATTESADVLSLTRNATLANLSVPALKTVDSLEVVDNPQLSPATFANVKTFERIMAGNATTP